MMKFLLVLSLISCFVTSVFSQASTLVPAGWDPALAGDEVMDALITVTAPPVKGAHDAEMALVDGRAYVVAEVNEVRSGESAGWPEIYATLSIVRLNPLELEKVVPMARSEQVFENETLPVGACFVPRIFQKNEDTLRGYFTSEDPGKRQSQLWFRDYELKTDQFAPTIHRAKLKTATGTFDFQPQFFHADAAAQGFAKKAVDSSFFLFDSFKRFDGKLHVAVNNFTGKQNALALVHDDLATFEILGHYNEPQTEQLSESAVNRLPDGTWMAICRNDSGNYHFTTSPDGRTWSEGKEMPFVANGGNSKPTFDKFGDLYYLGWQEKTQIHGVHRSVFNVDISRDGKNWERKYRFESTKSFQYPTFREHAGQIWLCVTQGDTSESRKERIMFGRLEKMGEFADQSGKTRRSLPKPPVEKHLTDRREMPETDFSAMTSEEIRAFEIEVLEKVADLALVPPVPNTSPLPQYDYDRLDYGMTIGIERSPKGRLWACWVAGGDSPKAFFVINSSDDDGETWSKPRLVIDSHSNNLPRERSILVGNLWTDPKGRLWLFFDQSMDMFDGRGGVWAILCENPDADEPVWTKPRRLWHGVMLNKPTVLATGEWMLPISLDQRGGFGPFKGCFSELEPLRGANVFVTIDEGTTFERRGAAIFPNPDWHEHMVVERKDGSLWMLARTAKGIFESVSTDGGRTWSAAVPSAIQHPVARFHIRRLTSGRILLVKHGLTIENHEGRSQLTAWLSEDEGKTWQGGLSIDERKGISYPDGFQAPDGTIYLSYDRNRSTDGEILMARFTEEDILAREFRGPKSKGKILISRPLAREVGALPTFPGPNQGVKREIDLPMIDLSGEKPRHSIVAAGTEEVYQGHCDTVLLSDGKTMFTAWCLGHAQWIGPLAKSGDAGRTWSEPLSVPENWSNTSNTPTLHRLIGPEGKDRLFCFAGGLDWSRGGRPPYPMHQSISEDDGQTWSPMAPNGVEGEVPPKTILSFDEGRRLAMWSDLPGYVVQSESTDGGVTWSESRRILRVPDRWAQPCVIASPDGKTLAMLMRENSRRHHSLIALSKDEAGTWSKPMELPAALTGDRHVAKFAPDGRLVVAFRDMAKTSPTYGHYLAWVGRFENLVDGSAGDYRIKLLHNAARSGTDVPGKGNTDCGYSDLEVLPDGTFIATTYLKYAAGPEKHSVVNTRFRLEEIDAMK